MKIALFLVSFGVTTINATAVLPRALNGACTGAGGAPGVCVRTASCSSAGGTSIQGACPNDPYDVRCCTKTSCGSGGAGNCRFTSSCSSGKTETNKCPGPANFKCCMPGGGAQNQPALPTRASGCQQVAINGAKAIIDQFPGRVRQIGCKRDCSGSSEHCIGKATDLMVGPYGVSSTQAVSG